MRSSYLAIVCLAVVLLPVTSCGGGDSTGPAVPARLVFSVQPSAATAGAAFTPLPQVTVQDGSGNVVSSSTLSITIALANGTTGANLRGTRTVSAVNGVAVFNGLSIDSAGTGYVLTATASGLPTASSASFGVTAAPALVLVFTAQPTSVASASAISPAISVALRDSLGNSATTAANSVTLAITSGTGTSGAVLGGTTTVAAAGGVATFNTLTVDKAGTGYTLTAAGSGLTSATSTSFAVGAGAAAKLAFGAQPTSVVAGASITPAVQVVVQDAQGNTVTGSTASVTVAITSGTGTSGAVLGGTLTQSAVSGVATFSNLTVDKAGTGYTLTATATGLTGATSTAFVVTAGVAAKLAFTVQPSNVAAGTLISPVIQVKVQDLLGNTVTNSTASVTLAITSGTGTAGAVLGGTVTVAAVGGVATFGTLTIDKAGSGYTLAATATSLSSAASVGFNVSPGAATKLVFAVQPSAVMAGAAISPAVQVVVQDAFGNTVTSSTASITLAITSGTGTSGAVLGGTVTAAAVNGVATFSTLTLDRVGTGYTLTATATNLTNAVSSAFAVTRGTVSITPQETRLSAGYHHTCELTTGGAAYCWGSNGNGKLGDGTTSNRSSAVAVLGGLVFQAISGGSEHTCGLTTGGAAYCWGYNTQGQLGDGTTTQSNSPVAVLGGLVFQAISTGEMHACGLTADGAAYCWGYNDFGQLGDGTTTQRTSPVACSGSS